MALGRWSSLFFENCEKVPHSEMRLVTAAKMCKYLHMCVYCLAIFFIFLYWFETKQSVENANRLLFRSTNNERKAWLLWVWLGTCTLSNGKISGWSCILFLLDYFTVQHLTVSDDSLNDYDRMTVQWVLQEYKSTKHFFLTTWFLITLSGLVCVLFLILLKKNTNLQEY
jgi:hypothetical protein